MRSCWAVIKLTTVLATFAVLFGQSRQENWDLCFGSDPEQSIAGCSAIIQSGQENDASLSKVFDTRGLAYMHKRDYVRAIQDYDQAIRLNPRSATAIYNRALTYRRIGDYDPAISDYDRVLQLTPNDADSYYGRGASYAHEGDYDRAIQDYDQAFRINPRMAYVFHSRSIAYAHKGDYLNAIADYVRWRGILGITRLALALVALAFGVLEARKGDRHSVQSLRRALGWLFAAQSLWYLEKALRSIPGAIHQHTGFVLLEAPAFSLLVT
jgi:tetratricopeptide (TPR) repeat protein